MISWDSYYDELEKLAGGGARTLKSFRRSLQRMAESIARREGGDANKILKDLVEKGKSGIHHTYSPGARQWGSPAAAGLRGVPKGGTTHFTSGGYWPGGDVTRPTSSDTIPFRDIRKMRGRFGIDPSAANMPIGQKANALVFRGGTGKARVVTKQHTGSLKDAPGLPERLRFPGVGAWSSPLGYPRGDAQVQRPFIRRVADRKIWGGRLVTEQEHILDAARGRGGGPPRGDMPRRTLPGDTRKILEAHTAAKPLAERLRQRRTKPRILGQKVKTSVSKPALRHFLDAALKSLRHPVRGARIATGMGEGAQHMIGRLGIATRHGSPAAKKKAEETLRKLKFYRAGGAVGPLAYTGASAVALKKLLGEEEL